MGGHDCLTLPLSSQHKSSTTVPRNVGTLATSKRNGKVELASFLLVSTHTLSAGCLGGWIDGPEQVKDSSACRNVGLGERGVLHW